MIFRCENCSYSSTRYQNVLRHKNRRFTCDVTSNKSTKQADATKTYKAADTKQKTSLPSASPPPPPSYPPPVVPKFDEWSYMLGYNAGLRAAGVNVPEQYMPVSGTPLSTTIKPAQPEPAKPSRVCDDNHDEDTETAGEHSCERCDKTFKTKRYLTRHAKTCKGTPRLTCTVCSTSFANYKAKYRHKCEPPPPPPPDTMSFGESPGPEDLWKGIHNKREMNHRLGNCTYAITDQIETLFFNDQFPQCMNIRKWRMHDELIEIYMDGKWVMRFYDDVHDKISKHLENYFEAYFREVSEETEGFQASRLPRRGYSADVKRFCHNAVWLNFGCDAVRDSYTINDPYDDEKEAGDRMRRYKTLIKANLYALTMARYSNRKAADLPMLITKNPVRNNRHLSVNATREVVV